MLSSFQEHIKQQQLFSIDDSILLTVSGGIDSVVMCHLFHDAGIKFGIAHCNFSLRGKESDGDETFVEALAEKYNVPFLNITFDTKAFSKKHKLSTQLAARELRYNWFEEIRKQYNYHYIATAHHLDDSIETFFINLVRGTGIAGLHGILPKQGTIIRPLLFASKNDILNYAKKHKIKYREDSSNASDKYTRNKIRHKVIPILKELNPNLEQSFSETFSHLKEVEEIYAGEIESKRSKLVKKQKEVFYISIAELKKFLPLSTYLFEFLKPFNFNSSVVNDIANSLNAESGKQFFSDTHRLIKDREYLIVQSLKFEVQSSKSDTFKVKKNQKEFFTPELKLCFQKKNQLSTLNFSTLNSIAQMDFDRLKFPLEIRKWQKGDEFYPLGMKGKKKLSDFFIDKKLSIPQKENTWLLISDNKIAWVIGLRIDDRFKITDTTKTIYSVNLC